MQQKKETKLLFVLYNTKAHLDLSGGCVVLIVREGNQRKVGWDVSFALFHIEEQPAPTLPLRVILTLIIKLAHRL
jgi:hypothetical protein